MKPTISSKNLLLTLLHVEKLEHNWLTFEEIFPKFYRQSLATGEMVNDYAGAGDYLKLSDERANKLFEPFMVLKLPSIHRDSFVTILKEFFFEDCRFTGSRNPDGSIPGEKKEETKQ